MTTDLPLARRDLIAARLAAGQNLATAGLAAEFAVSEDAIRRDLRALAAEGRCRRVYGGALPLTEATRPMHARVREDSARKSALARAAAAMVQPGELVFLDSSSPNLALVEFLPEEHELTIATNSIDIAAAVLRRPELKLIMIGGSVDATVGGATDATAVASIMRMHIDRCFLGVCSLSARAGVCAFNLADATFKQALAEASRSTVVLATPDKFHAHAPYRVADCRAIHCLVVNHDTPDADLESLSQPGCQIIKAAPF